MGKILLTGVILLLVVVLYNAPEKSDAANLPFYEDFQTGKNVIDGKLHTAKVAIGYVDNRKYTYTVTSSRRDPLPYIEELSLEEPRQGYSQGRKVVRRPWRSTSRLTSSRPSPVTDSRFLEAHSLLVEAGWPQHLHEQALRRIRCESRYDPKAMNAAGNVAGIDIGLFQNNTHFQRERMRRRNYTSEDLKDGVKNATLAYDIYRETKWREWYPSNRCFNSSTTRREVDEMYNRLILAQEPS